MDGILGEWVAAKHCWGVAVDPAECKALLRFEASRYSRGGTREQSDPTRSDPVERK